MNCQWSAYMLHTRRLRTSPSSVKVRVRSSLTMSLYVSSRELSTDDVRQRGEPVVEALAEQVEVVGDHRDPQIV